MNFLHEQIKQNKQLSKFAFGSGEVDTPFGFIDTEEFWLRDIKVAKFTDGWVIGKLYSHLIKNMPLSSIDAGTVEFLALIKRISSFVEKFGYEFKLIAGKVPSQIGESEPQHIQFNEFRTSVKSQLHISPYRQAKQEKSITRLAQGEYRKLLEQSGTSISICFNQSGLLSGDTFIEVVQINETQQQLEFKEAYSCHPLDAFSVSRDIMYDMHFKMCKPLPGCFLVPYENPEDGNDYESLKKFIYSHPALPQYTDDWNTLLGFTTKALLENSFVQYVKTSFPSFMESVAIKKPFLLMRLLVVENLPLCYLLVVKVPNYPGYFIKAVAKDLSLGLSSYIDKAIESGSFRLFENDLKRDYAFDIGVRGFRLVFCYWNIL